MEHGTNFRAPCLFLLDINKYFTESTAPNSPPEDVHINNKRGSAIALPRFLSYCHI